MSGWAESLTAGLLSEEEASLQEKLTALREEFSALPGMDVNFANGLNGLLDALHRPLNEGESREESSQCCEILYQWFEGGKVSKKDLKPFQIFEILNKTNSKRFLSSLVAYLRHLGGRRLILLMDENGVFTSIHFSYLSPCGVMRLSENGRY